MTNTFFYGLYSAFLRGTLPFSVWVTKLAGGNVHAVGDHNPGATNALKAGEWMGRALTNKRP